MWEGEGQGKESKVKKNRQRQGDNDGDLGRYKGKEQWVLKNMKDKDREHDGFQVMRG